MPDFEVVVPATSANMGPGFDCLGLALPVYNRFRIDVAPAGAPSYRLMGEGAAEPLEAGRNLFLVAAERLAAEVGTSLPPLSVVCEAAIPLGRGLGSSASAVVGGLMAANHVLGEPLAQADLLRLATALEGHPDNVAPALLGGVCLALEGEGGLIVERLMVAEEPGLVVAVPAFELATAIARAALPSLVPHADAVYNVGRAALLVSALFSGRYERLAEALADRLHQPYRAPLVPGMAEVTRAAREAGAWGTTLSGAGPTLLAWCPVEGRDAVARAMAEAWAEAGIVARAFPSAIAAQGATIHPAA
ncbi:homoserine kinase [bacterium]|nr:homoserine kinase [bacterium]